MTNNEIEAYKVLFSYYADWFASVASRQASEHDLGQHLYEQLSETAKKAVFEAYEENNRCS
jgi:hypothetical protein